MFAANNSYRVFSMTYEYNNLLLLLLLLLLYFFLPRNRTKCVTLTGSSDEKKREKRQEVHGALSSHLVFVARTQNGSRARASLLLISNRRPLAISAGTARWSGDAVGAGSNYGSICDGQTDANRPVKRAKDTTKTISFQIGMYHRTM